jgi:hypothetical protein
VGTAFNDTLVDLNTASTSYRYVPVPGVPAFHWTLTAVDACGEGAPLVFDAYMQVTPPNPVFTVAATDGPCTVHVAWTMSSAGDRTGIHVVRSAPGTADVTFTLGPSATSLDDASATPGVVYTYSVTPFNACGDSTTPRSDTGFRGAPPAPTAPAAPVRVPRAGTATLTAAFTASPAPSTPGARA